MNGPWQLPGTWTWAESRDIAHIVGGGTPRTDDATNFDDGDIPWITPADLSGYKEKYISYGARNITRRGLENSGARLMPKGALLFSSRAPIGYVAIAANPVSTNQGFKSFILHSSITSDYAYYYLQRAKDLAVALSSGTTFREISGAKAALIPFPLAPTSEQQRIVAEIEKQFTRLDAAVAALNRAKANLKRYRASVLKAACEGRLVSTEAELAHREGRSYEPASELLNRILAERRDHSFSDRGKNKAKQDKLKQLEMIQLSDLPEGWAWTTVGELTALEQNSITDGPFGSNLKTNHYTTVGPRVIRLQNIGDGAFIDAEAHISKEHYEKLAKHRVFAGDIVIAALGERPPRCCVIPPTVGEAIVKADCIRFKAASNAALSLFLNLVLNAEPTKARMAQIVHGVGRPRLNLTEIKAIPIPLPPIDEQQRIVLEAERRLSIIDEMEMQFHACLQRSEGLRQAILKRAFEGKLVPQDPNDEPASLLVERIRVEREKRDEEEKANRKSNRKSIRKREVASV